MPTWSIIVSSSGNLKHDVMLCYPVCEILVFPKYASAPSHCIIYYVNAVHSDPLTANVMLNALNQSFH